MGAPNGEFELIAAIRERAARAGAPAAGSGLVVGSGDDAAVSVRGGAAVTSVDTVVEGVHFDLATASLESVGRKALATALSDLAAMGAEAAEAYVQIGLPERLDRAECLKLADGLAAVAAEHRVALAGGDLSRSPVLFVAVTVVGSLAAADRAVLRSGARRGDAVVVTGELGGAAAGLLALERPGLDLGADLLAALARRQLEPPARLAAGVALARAGATAMIDISDGLGADAGHLAAASGVAIRIELARLPLEPGVAEVALATGADSLELASARGEDYELLATLAPERLEAARAAVEEAGARLTEIGSVSAGDGVELIDPGGAVRRPGGFDQLAPRPPGGRY